MLRVLRTLLGGGQAGGQSEALARVQLLNAKPENVRVEAQIIAQAGLPGAVTIATNMAGRGTDIILGGNPEGLSQLALLRLVYRRLSPAAHMMGDGGDGDAAAAAAAATHEEDEIAATAAAGGIAVPRLPLAVFDPYDAPDPVKIAGAPRSPDQIAAGLPRELHLALLAAVLLAHTQGQAAAAAVAANGGGGPSAAAAAAAAAGASYEAVSARAAAALEAAGALRRTVLRRVRQLYGGARIEASLCFVLRARSLLSRAHMDGAFVWRLLPLSLFVSLSPSLVWLPSRYLSSSHPHLDLLPPKRLPYPPSKTPSLSALQKHLSYLTFQNAHHHIYPIQAGPRLLGRLGAQSRGRLLRMGGGARRRRRRRRRGRIFVFRRPGAQQRPRSGGGGRRGGGSRRGRRGRPAVRPAAAVLRQGGAAAVAVVRPAVRAHGGGGARIRGGRARARRCCFCLSPPLFFCRLPRAAQPPCTNQTAQTPAATNPKSRPSKRNAKRDPRDNKTTNAYRSAPPAGCSCSARRSKSPAASSSS